MYRSAAVLAILVLGMLLPAQVQAAPAHAPTLARIRAIIHGLSVQPPHKHAHKGKKADPLYQQYILQTQHAQRASVSFKDSSILYLNQMTYAVLQNPHTTLVKSGEVDEVHAPGSNHTVITNSAAATAIGTNFDVRVKGKLSVFIVVAGSLQVKNKKGQVTVNQNQETTVVTNKPPTPPAPVDAQAAIGWTVAVSSGGWEALSPGSDFNPKGVAVDAQGNIYATDYSADRVVKFSPAGKQLLTWGSKGTGPGQFDAPIGIAADGQGNVWVSDGGNDRIEKFTSSGQYESQVGETGVLGNDATHLWSPDGISVDKQGNLYVADQGNDRISVFTPDGQPTAQIGSLGEGPNLSEPEDVAVDNAGNIYVADTLNSRAVKMDRSGNVLTVYGSKGKALGQLDTPFGIAVDGAGNVFVSDTLNGRIQEFANNGEFLTSWGSFGDAIGQFDESEDVFIDRTGTIYEVDGHRIQRLPNGAVGTG